MFDINSKRNQIKIKGIKPRFKAQKNQWQVVAVSKPKYINGSLALATIWYKIEDHQNLSSSWNWRFITFSYVISENHTKYIFV